MVDCLPLGTLFATMADPFEELNAVFAMIDITDAAVCTFIIEQEGLFTQIKDLATLKEDRDVDEMAKWMATRIQAEGRVLLGTIIIQRLKTLVWWIADAKKCRITPVVADFTIDVMEQANKEKLLMKEMVEKELVEKEPTIKDLGKFDPNDF